MGRLVRFCKCAICAMAEKQKNAGGAKIKSFLVGSCVVQVFIFSVSVVIVNLIFLFLLVCFFGVVVFLPLAVTVGSLAFVRDFRAQICQPSTKFDLKNYT